MDSNAGTFKQLHGVSEDYFQQWFSVTDSVIQLGECKSLEPGLYLSSRDG